ncbi:MAG: hypothetical protein Q9208_000352 [Pyrenodesmia sp. 3 TL-2023]
MASLPKRPTFDAKGPESWNHGGLGLKKPGTSGPPPPKAAGPSKVGTIYQQKPEDISMVAWQRINWASMSYRDDSNQPWTRVDASFVPQWSKDSHPEPASVQEVMISDKGIKLRQYDDEYIPKYPDRQVGRIRQAQSGWEVVIALDKISDVVVSEYEASWVETQREKRRFCVIRFKYGGIKASKDISRGEEEEEEVEAEVASVHGGDEDDDNGHDAIVNSGGEDEGAAITNDEGEANDDTADDEKDEGIPPAEYPLARLCEGPDALVGKEVRLAFLNRTKKGSVYKWIWPTAITHLSGERFKMRPNNEKIYTLPLDEWARKTKRWPPATFLTEVKADGGVEWKLENAPQPAPQAASTSAGQFATSTPQGGPASANRPLAEESDAGFDARLAAAEKEVLERIEATQLAKAAFSAAQKAENQAKNAFLALQKEKRAREDRDRQGKWRRLS